MTEAIEVDCFTLITENLHDFYCGGPAKWREMFVTSGG